jgi:CHAD domain-containing protein
MADIDEDLGGIENRPARQARTPEPRPGTALEPGATAGQAARERAAREPDIESWTARDVAVRLELGERLLALADTLLAQLRDASAVSAAGPDQTPGNAGAVAAPLFGADEVIVPHVSSDATAGEVVRWAIGASVVRLIRHDAVMRAGVDPEGVHQARVATRRLRSDLRTFRPLLDRQWASGLRDELGWLARLLGVVRDGDVMLERMRTRASELPSVNARGARAVVATLEHEREVAHAALLAALRTERYPALVKRLVESANEPALAPRADRPAREVLPRLVRRPWRVLARQVKTLGDSPTDEQLHEVRIATKRVRYAAEATVPAVGRSARPFARAAAGLQEVLGELNDAVVAQQWLSDWVVASRSSDAAFAAGELAGLERAAALAGRTRWQKAWKELASPRLRAWM